MTDRVDDDLIANYIRRFTVPMQWVGWWLDSPDPATRESLRLVLFEPSGEALRSLTEPTVRDAVIRAVLENEPLRTVVALDVDRLLEELTEEAIRISQRNEA
ncbi:MAG: hypothetical protein SFU86_06505 [Pirellulaceae bacterium]|nr:hypothetical protein [Pirellulaceae bacterium]